MGFFLFHLDLKLSAKIKKDLVSTHLFFTLLLIPQDLNKIKKNPHTLLQTLHVENVCKISAKLSKFSIFQTKKPGFLEIIDVCLNLGIGFCIT